MVAIENGNDYIQRWTTEDVGEVYIQRWTTEDVGEVTHSWVT